MRLYPYLYIRKYMIHGRRYCVATEDHMLGGLPLIYLNMTLGL